MKTKMLCCATALAFAGISASANAQLGDLTPIPYVSYGDGQSFSLPIAQIVCENTFNVNCTSYRVASTPGQIQDLVVIATGSEGKQLVENFDGMDNAYSTPSGVNGSVYFQTEAATSRGSLGTINNNLDTTWDSSLAALQTFLAGDAPIFFFNNNQVNSGASTNQHLAAWARLWITDAAGNVVQIGGTDSLTFANRTPIIFPAATDCVGGAGIASPYAIVPNGGGCPSAVDPNNVFDYTDPSVGPNFPGPVFGDNTATDYVLSGGRVCLDAGFVPVPCDGSGGAIAYNNIDHNLGADTVAYAIIFPELNTALANLFGSLTPAQLADYTFHLDLRLGCELTSDPDNPTCTGRSLNNGFEQLFLGTVETVTTVPEPGTLALLGGLLGILPLVRKLRRRSREV